MDQDDSNQESIPMAVMPEIVNRASIPDLLPMDPRLPADGDNERTRSCKHRIPQHCLKIEVQVF